MPTAISVEALADAILAARETKRRGESDWRATRRVLRAYGFSTRAAQEEVMRYVGFEFNRRARRFVERVEPLATRRPT